MEFPVKVRIEVGPGLPSQFAPLNRADATRALLTAVQEILATKDWPMGQPADARCGPITVRAIPVAIDGGGEPAGENPRTQYTELRLEVEMEGGE
jgi:hypothetical protein